MALVDLKLNDVVSFSTHAVGILASSYKDVVFKDRVSAESARFFGVDVTAQWRSIYPSLPDGVVNDPYQYEWLTFTNSSGELIVLCSAWINESTLESSASTHYRIDVYDGNSTFLADARKALNAMGYYNMEIVKVTN